MMIPMKTLYEHPYVTANEWEDLVIFNYTRGCQFDRAWDEVTLSARGLIYNKVTGELIARGFPKFFNAEELGLDKLPQLPFSATVKMDGSLGIQYFYKGQYWISTRGAIQSEIAQWTTAWLRQNADLSQVKEGWTYLYEVISKINKIVIDYGDYEGLTLLACINTATGEEMPYEEIVEEARRLKLNVTKRIEGFKNFDELFEHCKQLPADQEGYVITYSNGLKVKVKGLAYSRIHKMLSKMTLLAFWDAWDLNQADIPKEYMVQMPEEFREVVDALYEQTYKLHWDRYRYYEALHAEVTKILGDSDRKVYATYVKERYPNDFSGIMLFHNPKKYKLWFHVHQRVRPKNNQMPEGIAGVDRIKRILEDL